MPRFWILLAVLPLLASAPASGSPRLDRVTFESGEQAGSVIMRFRLSRRPVAIGEPHIVAPGLVEITLYNAWVGRGGQFQPAIAPIAAYDTKQDGRHLRVSIALDIDRVSLDFSRDPISDDLLLTVAPLDPEESLASERAGPEGQTEPPRSPNNHDGATSTVQATPPAHRDAPHLEPAQPDEGASVPAAQPDPQDEAAPEAAARWRIDTIVIDAGHGGKDTGALGHRGLREKDVVLAVALKLGAYLEDRLGVQVVYTRDDDRFIELHERGSIANRAGAKLFVSIHANAARASSAHGTETFFLGMHRTESARNVMERENSVISLEDDQTYYEKYDQAGMVRMQLAQSVFMRKSEHLASLVQDQFTERVDRRNRGVKQAGFVVLYEAAMPSILVELGFVTNPSEAAFLRSRRGQDYLASAIFRAIRSYKEAIEAELDVVSASLRDD